MNMEWISENGTGLLGILVGVGFLVVAYIDAHYRYFHIAVALVAFIYAYKQLKKRATPFERRERELRRKSM